MNFQRELKRFDSAVWLIEAGFGNKSVAKDLARNLLPRAQLLKDRSLKMKTSPDSRRQ